MCKENETALNLKNERGNISYRTLSLLSDCVKTVRLVSNKLTEAYTVTGALQYTTLCIYGFCSIHSLLDYCISNTTSATKDTRLKKIRFTNVYNICIYLRITTTSTKTISRLRCYTNTFRPAFTINVCSYTEIQSSVVSRTG